MTDEVNYQKMPNQDLKNNMRNGLEKLTMKKKFFLSSQLRNLHLRL